MVPVEQMQEGLAGMVGTCSRGRASRRHSIFCRCTEKEKTDGQRRARPKKAKGSDHCHLSNRHVVGDGGKSIRLVVGYLERWRAINPSNGTGRPAASAQRQDSCVSSKVDAMDMVL